MLSLPHGRVLLGIGWLLILLVVVGSLAPAGPVLELSISDKARHFLCYLALMLYFTGLYPRERHGLLAVAFFLMGVALELLQGALTATRHMDLHDVALNTGGIAAAFLLARLGLADWARKLDK